MKGKTEAWRRLVQRVERLSVPAGREAERAFSLEGYRSLERALRNGCPVEAVLMGEGVWGSETQRAVQLRADLAAAGVAVTVAPDAVLAGLTRGRGLGDVFGVSRMPAGGTLAELLSGEGWKLLVVGVSLGDPGNTGAVIRSSLAAGACGFLAVGSTDPWHPKAVRTSMGSLFGLPVLRVAEGSDWMGELEALGVETVASVCREATPLPEVEGLGEKVALLMGSEAFGLSEAVAARAARRVMIPMPEGVDSFSVNAAAAVMAYGLAAGAGGALKVGAGGGLKVGAGGGLKVGAGGGLKVEGLEG